MADPLIAELRRRAGDALLATDEAKDLGRTGAAPLDDRSIERAEAILGRPLPALLREIYLLVGNGGFGPGFGLLPLVANPGESEPESVVGLFTAFCSQDPADPAWSWPSNLLPFCDWGCAIRSCVDCDSPDAAVVTFDPNVLGVGEPLSRGLVRSHTSLRSWLSDWIAGVKLWDLMFEPDPDQATAIVNPFTSDPIRVVPNRLKQR